MPSTEIEGKAIPKMPSNFEAKKATPLSYVDSPKSIFLTVIPETVITSLEINPDTDPDP